MVFFLEVVLKEHIRKYLIEDKNYLDAIIGLPSNIFLWCRHIYCFTCLKKKSLKTQIDILFIDASKHFEKVGNKMF